jgi:hypothetical protein
VHRDGAVPTQSRIMFDRNFGSLEECVAKKVGEAGRRVDAT